MTKHEPCSGGAEAHEAHMQLNGECPWCGGADRDAIREPAEWDFPDAHTIDTSSSGPKHPEIEVQLIGGDGNAFAIIGAVHRAMKRAGLDRSEIEQFDEEAMAGDYDQLLATVMRWVEVA
jgi:hypothetical protein